MTTMVDGAEDTAGTAITAGRLRSLLHDLPDDAPVHVGVFSQFHFNHLVGSLPVTDAQVEPSANGVWLILHVPGVS